MSQTMETVSTAMSVLWEKNNIHIMYRNRASCFNTAKLGFRQRKISTGSRKVESHHWNGEQKKHLQSTKEIQKLAR